MVWIIWHCEKRQVKISVAFNLSAIKTGTTSPDKANAFWRQTALFEIFCPRQENQALLYMSH